MRLAKVRIRNFRSIEDETIQLGPLHVLVGPNSSGKSNIFRAILFPFQETIERQDVYDNLCSWVRDTPGAPRLSIYVDLHFGGKGSGDLLSSLIGGESTSDVEVHIAFRAIRSGNVSFRCNGRELDPSSVERLRDRVRLVFIPSIRDLDHGGIEPFQRILADALRRGRGETIAKKQQEVRDFLTTKAGGLLAEAERELRRHLPSLQLLPDAESVSLEEVYKHVHLCTQGTASGKLKVSSLGTGHQSVLIMALHKALAADEAALTLFLIDEPCSHLHPSAIAVLREELASLSDSSQVLTATHSPGLVRRIGLRQCVRVEQDEGGKTRCQNLSELLTMSDKELEAILFHHQLRALEPMFSREVIIVEGTFDATVIRKTAQLLGLGLPEDRNVPVIAAGGKGPMPRLVAVLRQCGSRRIVVLLDADAKIGGGESVIRQRARSEKENKQLLNSIDVINGELTGNKRAAGIAKNLRAVGDELRHGASATVIYDGSHLEQVVEALGILRASDKQELKRGMQAEKVNRPRELLRETGIFLLNNTTDLDMLSRPGSEDIVANVLRQSLGDKPNAEKRRIAASWLKNLTHDPDKLCKILERLHTEELLSPSALGKTVRSLMGSLTS